MTERKRLKAAERRVVRAQVDLVIEEMRPLIEQTETVLVDMLMALPEELRYEGLRMAMNEWGGGLFTGACAGLMIGEGHGA